MSLDLSISKNVLQIGEARVSRFEFIHTLSESKSIFEIEQNAIVSCFVKNVAFLLGHPVEHNISYQPGNFQLPRMSGANFTEGVENTPPPPSAVPGAKSPVLLGLKGNLYLCHSFVSRNKKK